MTSHVGVADPLNVIVIVLGLNSLIHGIPGDVTVEENNPHTVPLRVGVRLRIVPLQNPSENHGLNNVAAPLVVLTINIAFSPVVLRYFPAP